MGFREIVLANLLVHVEIKALRVRLECFWNGVGLTFLVEWMIEAGFLCIKLMLAFVECTGFLNFNQGRCRFWETGRTKYKINK